MESVQKYLPLLTAMGIAGCISHAAGLYRFAGDGWLSVMSVADILAQTWPVIPFLAAAVASGVCLRALAGPGRAFAVVVEEQRASPKRVVRAWAGFKSLAAFHLGLVAIVGFFPLVLLLEPRWASLSVLLAVVVGAALAFTTSEIPEVERRPAALVASLCFFYIAAAYSSGLARGAFPFIVAPSDLVVTATGERCVSVISVMSHGVLYTPDRKAVEFVKWDDVVRVVRNSSCGRDAPDA